MNSENAGLADCPCTGKTLERLVRPAALLVLAQGDLYGYRLVQRLAEMPTFAGRQPNTAGVYRCLKSMAEEGLISAAWELSEAGPAKRMYHLTEQGEECLGAWMATLSLYREAVDGLLQLGADVLRQRAACCCCEEE